jgi:hypothetical protein
MLYQTRPVLHTTDSFNANGYTCFKEIRDHQVYQNKQHN